MLQLVLLLSTFFCFASDATHDELRRVHSEEGLYGIGTGIADVTGPIAEVGMMGYGSFTQQAHGLHMRLRSRAFVLYDPNTAQRFALVVVDIGMIFDSIKRGVLKRLQREIPNVYHHDNLMLSATHTHSGPGGFAYYPLYNATTFGFNQQTYEAIVVGITESIVNAHHTMTMGHISHGQTELHITHNRSHAAYLNNAAQDVSAYSSSTNPTMHLLKFVSRENKPLGAITWFAIHPVSLTLKNQLVSGDNKGLAAYLFEKRMGVTYQDSDEFVAAFAQADEGDVSPYDVHNPPTTSEQEFAHLEQVAQAQADAAWSLFVGNLDPVTGPMQTRHQFVAMSELMVSNEFTNDGEQRLCNAALGKSFAAGTENGRPGMAIFDEGSIEQSSERTCHGEKPVLIDNRVISTLPEIMPFHAMRIGSVLLLGIPGEMTTMAGRKLRATVAAQFDGPIILNGLSNDYGHYIATRREYAAQHYEGASTLYGPFTSAAYEQIFSDLTNAIMNNRVIAKGPEPQDMSHLAVSFSPGVIMDSAPFRNFGDIQTDAKDQYVAGETVTAIFVGAHPNNELRPRNSYLTVERLNGDKFVPVYFDWDHNTTLRWKRVRLAESLITITWKTDPRESTGHYRICHNGAAKNILGRLTRYHGCSREFMVTR